MLSTVQELENNTRLYWRISQAFNLQTERIATSDAMDLVVELKYGMNPQRPICRRSCTLLNDIIQGTGTLVTTSQVYYLTK